MAVIGDVLRITSVKEYADQLCLNVYFYVLLNQGFIPNGLADIAQSFYTLEKQALEPFTSVFLYSGKIVIENITHGNENAEYTPARESIGIVTGDPSPAHDAVGVRLNRSTRVTRHGQKRYTGLAESAYSSGILDDTASIVASLTPLLVGDVDLAVGLGDVFECSSVIVGRNLDGTPDITRLNVVSSVTVNQYVTTQVSRKQGRS